MEKSNNIIQINGVYLTPKAIKALQDIQDDNNIYTLIIENLDKVAMYIADFDPEPENGAEQLENIKRLSFIRGYIKDLKRPEISC